VRKIVEIREDGTISEAPGGKREKLHGQRIQNRSERLPKTGTARAQPKEEKANPRKRADDFGDGTRASYPLYETQKRDKSKAEKRRRSRSREKKKKRKKKPALESCWFKKNETWLETLVTIK